MKAGVRLPLNMKYYELLSIYQYLNELRNFGSHSFTHIHFQINFPGPITIVLLQWIVHVVAV